MSCPIHSYESTSLHLLTTAFAPAAPPTSSAYLNPIAFLHNQVNRLSSEQYSQDAKVNLLAPQVYTQLPQAHLVSFPAPAAVSTRSVHADDGEKEKITTVIITFYNAHKDNGPVTAQS